MPEDFYAALMMRRALPTTTDLKTITAPGIYPVDAGNDSAPGKFAGTLIVYLPTTAPKRLFFTATGDGYFLTSPGWQIFGTIKTINAESPNADGEISISAADVGAVPASGGSVEYLDGATYYQANPETWMGAGLFSEQYGNYAPFHLPYGYEVTKGAAKYLPLIKGVTSTEEHGFGAAVSFGALRTGNADFGSAVVHIVGDNGTAAVYQLNIDGSFHAPSSLWAGNAQMIGNGDVYGTVWGGWLSEWVRGNFATSAWTIANFLQGGIRLASAGVATNGNNDNQFAYAPNGTVVTAVQQQTNYTAVQYRSLQYNIGGNWYTAWVA